MAQISDIFILECCLQNKREPYIGINSACQKNAIFCIEHSCHKNTEGLIHEMLPLRQFKRKIDQRKFCMQNKISSVVETFSHFIEQLIQQIQQIKLRKCLELSMLWLRDLASCEDEYELMKKVYRMDFEGLSCRDINSIYYKIIHNESLYSKDINELPCYQGICKALEQLSDNRRAINLLSEKLTQIQGVLTNGQILKKVLPDRRQLSQTLKQVLLQPQGETQKFDVQYNKSKLLISTPSYSPFTSKYPLIPHITYHISISTKYSNIMLGVCSEQIKKNQIENDLHYCDDVIVFNFANGNTYKEGMFVSGSNQGVKGLNSVNVKLRVTDAEVFIMTKKKVLMRERIGKLGKNLYLLGMARSEGDSFEIHCDNDMSADNVQVLNLIKHEQQKQISPKPQIPQIVNKTASARQSQSYQQPQQQKNSVERIKRQLQQQKVYKQNTARSFQQKVQPQDHRTVTQGRNFQRLGQIVEEESHMENTTGEFRDRSAINNHEEGRHSFGRVSQKDSNLNSQINKIKSEINNLKMSLTSQQNYSRKNSQKSIHWKEQKDNYLKDVKQRLSQLKKGSSQQTPIQKKYAQQNQKSSSRKNSQSRQPENKNRLPSQSSAFEKVKTGSEADNSKIRINISDEASQFTSLIKMSLLSGPRKRSDEIVMDQQKLKANCLMTESMQPQQPQTRVNKAITPPKMNNFDQRFKVNQSFEF